MVRSPHTFHDLLTLLLRYAALLGHYLAEDVADLPCHVSGVTADVEVRLLLQQLVDLIRALGETVLDVDLLGSVSRKGGDDLEGVAEVFAPLL